MQPLATTVMSLLLAHLVGDFPLQSGWIADHKGRRVLPTVIHAAIHYAVAWACLKWFAEVAFLSQRNQLLVGLYVAIHIAIDVAKCRLVGRELLPVNWAVFLADQLLHVAVIVGIACAIANVGPQAVMTACKLSATTRERILLLGIVYIAVVFAGGYLIRFLTRGLLEGISIEKPAQLTNAGLYIGWLERFLVITAVAVQSPAMVGLILTSKSIARFPELKENGAFAEYFLIGSLLSFGIAFVGGLVLVRAIYGSISLR